VDLIFEDGECDSYSAKWLEKRLSVKKYPVMLSPIVERGRSGIGLTALWLSEKNRTADS
jgi:hypothetical protein